MKTLIVTLLLCCCLAAPASAQQDGWPTHLALGAFITLNGMDIATSMYLIGGKHARELNPVVASFSNNPLVFGAVKGGIAAATSYWIWHMHKKHPRTAWITATICSGIYAGIVVNNARLLR